MIFLPEFTTLRNENIRRHYKQIFVDTLFKVSEIDEYSRIDIDTLQYRYRMLGMILKMKFMDLEGNAFHSSY
jgi:hypothetical protein